MLAEIRQSKDKAEIKERLDKLEQENAELRARPTGGLFHDEPFEEMMQSKNKAGVMIAVGVPLFTVFLVVLLPRMGSTPPVGYIMISIAVFALLLGLFAFMVAKRKAGRRTKVARIL